MHEVLFLCTGNYYRSRFAELLFNHLAEQRQMPWRATSRGLALERGTHNVGPMSEASLSALRQIGVDVGSALRFPLGAEAPDFERADLVIALDETEHRSLMTERFPMSAAKVDYLRIHDLDRTTADVALVEIEEAVRDLVDRLAASG